LQAVINYVIKKIQIERAADFKRFVKKWQQSTKQVPTFRMFLESPVYMAGFFICVQNPIL
jgi:hypothetical protein